jgi:uncharacterized protein (DUF1330 family)
VRRLVTIDLTDADLALFETYEATVLPLLEKHGGRLEMRVRSLDGRCETHLVYFPDARCAEDYRSDPIRVVALGEWERCGAKSVVAEVEQVG